MPFKEGTMSTTTHRRFDPWRPAPVKEESRTQIVESHYFNVDRVSFVSPDVGHFERFLLQENHGDTVGVLALTDDGRIPLIEQYRIPTHRWTLEIPAGHALADSERPQDVAIRKLREEVGYEADHFSQFGRFINTPSFSTQHTALFYATGLTPADRTEVGPESPRSAVRLYTPEEAYQMILNGTIVDAKSVIAILRSHGGGLDSLGND
jgi:ADP-ribose pyrophosphatase